MSRDRDSQRSKLYNAERTAVWSAKATAPMTPNEIEAFSFKVAAWLHDHTDISSAPLRSVSWRQGRGGANASRPSRHINYNGVTEPWIVIHEVAHLAYPLRVPGFEDVPDVAAHGRAFAYVYLRLVRHFFGVDDYNTLKRSFRDHKVRYAPKRQVSEAQRAAAAERFATTRPVREKSPHLFALTRQIDGVTVYKAKTESRDSYYRPGCYRYDGLTANPDRALTRATRAGIDKLAREWSWRGDWEIVDLNAERKDIAS